MLIKDRIFIPGRFVVESLGAEVDWDNSLKAMIIKTENISEIEGLVNSFGEKLHLVSLLAPRDVLEKDMEEVYGYGQYITSTLLERWKTNPEEAPGRLISGPWPDRIELRNIRRLTEDKYLVYGDIIEVTSVEELTGGYVAKNPVAITIVREKDSWLIDDMEEFILYKNTEYGFDFRLPTWP